MAAERFDHSVKSQKYLLTKTKISLFSTLTLVLYCASSDGFFFAACMLCAVGLAELSMGTSQSINLHDGFICTGDQANEKDVT